MTVATCTTARALKQALCDEIDRMEAMIETMKPGRYTFTVFMNADRTRVVRILNRPDIERDVRRER